MLRCIQGKYLLVNGKLRGIGTVEITNYSIKNEDLADDAVDERVIKDNIDLSTIGVIAKTKTSLITPDADLDLGSYGLKIGGTTVIDSSRNLVNINSLSFVKASDEVKITLEALDADDTNTTRNSPIVKLIGKYWDGSASQSVDASIQHVVIDTSPTSKISFLIGGSEKAYIKSDGTLALIGSEGDAYIFRRYYYNQYNDVLEIKRETSSDTGPTTVTLLPAPDNRTAFQIYSLGKVGSADVERLSLQFGYPLSGAWNIVSYASGTGTLRDIVFVMQTTSATEILRIKSNGDIQIGGTTVISSDRVLQNVSIDRASTDLPPCKVLEDRSEHTAYNDSDSTAPIYALATDTYVDSDSVGYKQVKIIYEAKCDNGVGWAVKVEDDSGNVLYENNGTNTSYSTYSSGWIDFPVATTKLKVYVGAYYDGTTADTGYIRNIRIYCR